MRALTKSMKGGRLPFEQQPGESNQAFAAFTVYLSLGSERTMKKVARKLGKKTVWMIHRWSYKCKWTERVAAHAAHLAKVELEATEALARGKSAQWLTREQANREEEWEYRGELVASARVALAKFKDGEKEATLGDIARALEIASKLGRLACGVATNKSEVTVENGGPIRLELDAALDRIYGKTAPSPMVVDVEPIAADRRELPEGTE